MNRFFVDGCHMDEVRSRKSDITVRICGSHATHSLSRRLQVHHPPVISAFSSARCPFLRLKEQSSSPLHTHLVYGIINWFGFAHQKTAGRESLVPACGTESDANPLALTFGLRGNRFFTSGKRTTSSFRLPNRFPSPANSFDFEVRTGQDSGTLPCDYRG